MLAQSFVQRNYVYDAGFMARPEVKTAVARRRPGRGNHHLEALHASGHGDVLGYGICYELNTMVVELLRHLGVPAMVGTGWVLDRGMIDRPDHLFALAIVPSPGGPCVLPLDSATGAQGPQRPMATTARRTADRTPHTLAPPPEVTGPWSANAVYNMPSEEELERRLEQLRANEQRALHEEVTGLAELILHVLSVRGRAPSKDLERVLGDVGERGVGGSTQEQLHALQRAAVGLLGRPELVRVLQGVMSGDYDEVAVVPAEVRELVGLELVRVESLSRYHVSALTRARVG